MLLISICTGFLVEARIQWQKCLWCSCLCASDFSWHCWNWLLLVHIRMQYWRTVIIFTSQFSPRPRSVATVIVLFCFFLLYIFWKCCGLQWYLIACSSLHQSTSLRGLAEGDILDPAFQQRLEDARSLLRQEIQRELKIKEAAERLRRAVTNRKSAADVDGQLRASSRKLEQLHWELQELNARAMATERDNPTCKNLTVFF